MRQVGWCDLVTGNKRLQSCCLVSKSCPTLRDPMDCRPLCPWDSPGKNTRVGGHFLLQEIFPTQGSNPCLLRLVRWQVDSLPHSHQGSLPYPSCGQGWFSAGSSFPEQGGVGVPWGRGILASCFLGAQGRLPTSHPTSHTLSLVFCKVRSQRHLLLA